MKETKEQGGFLYKEEVGTQEKDLLLWIGILNAPKTRIIKIIVLYLILYNNKLRENRTVKVRSSS